MALYGAYKNGRFNEGAGKTLYRHTDGGSDNLSVVTHVMHWLLVWLGIFDEIIWFRFDAGHSHTELCDRFFSMIKRFFKIDGTARCERLDSFEDLEVQLRALFAKSSDGSTVELEYLFANWDFDHWFKECGSDAKKHLGGISFDNVFRYKYDPSAWNHDVYTKYLVFQKWKRHTDFINNMNKQREDKAIARMALVTAAYSTE